MVAISGGSVIDTAKAVSLIIAAGGKNSETLVKGYKSKTTLLLIAAHSHLLSEVLACQRLFQLSFATSSLSFSLPMRSTGFPWLGITFSNSSCSSFLMDSLFIAGSKE